MTEFIYTCWDNKRTKGETPEGEWILFLGVKKIDDNPKFPYEAGTGLIVHFWYSRGCLGAKHWDYRIFGTPTKQGIDLDFIKSINYTFVRVLDDWFEDFYRMSDDLYNQGSFRSPDFNKGRPDRFREFMSRRFSYFKEIEFENKMLRYNFSNGWFDRVRACG